MKFKHLVIVFNSIVIVIILVIAMLPLILAMPEFPANIQIKILPFLLFMALLLVSTNIFFFINYRLLLLMEREDWPALAFYLENKIYTKGKYSSRNVRLLAISYFVISDYSSVLKLESKVLHIKPSIINKNILIFGIARILTGNYAEAAAFFRMRMRGKDKQWVRWFYGFSQLLCGVFSEAETEFSSLALSSNNALITGLSAYFLCGSAAKNSLKPEECRKIAENGRKRVLKVYKNADKWQNEADNMQREVFIAIIRKYIDEAGEWLFDKDAV